MRLHPVRRLIIASAAAALVLSACGGGDTETAAGDGYVSPIGEYLGDDQLFNFGGSGSDEDRARMAEQERQREEAVALCMKEQGFEYIPRDTSDFSGGFFEVEEGLEYGSKEFAEKYGFGISTQRYSQAEVGPDLVGIDDSAGGPFGDPENDPNFEIMEGLDDGTRRAYEEALYGDQDFMEGFDPETMTEEELEAAEEEMFEDYEPSGCLNESFAEQGDMEFFNEFSNELEDMYEAVLDDPRVQSAYDEINACITEKGFEPLDIETGPWEEFEGELQEVDELLGGFPGEDMTEEDFAAMSDEELDAMFNQPREFSAEAKAKLGEIQEREIAYAVASFDCGGGLLEPPEGFYEVLAEYEQRFIDDNADKLSEYKDTLGDA